MAISKTIVERVWIGHDNTIELTLREDGALANLGSLTRATLQIGDALIDSDVHAGAFDWSQGNGILALKLGPHLTEEYNGFARLVLYTATTPNGVVWINDTGGSRLELRIIE